jgi:3D-(3,5/4)-trihydroxycyclohexane-1,2-dione acylhydrolase (decyclizing)
MVTAAALAHVNRLPVLFWCPAMSSPTARPTRCCSSSRISARRHRHGQRLLPPGQPLFRPHHMRPEHIADRPAPRLPHVMTDPADCGPVCLPSARTCRPRPSIGPESFFAPKVWRFRAGRSPTRQSLRRGGRGDQGRETAGHRGRRRGDLFAGRGGRCAAFASAHDIPVVETQAGKSALPFDHALNFGPVGVTGAPRANLVARRPIWSSARHAVPGLHHRVVVAVQEPGAKASCRSTCSLTTPSSMAR